MTRRKECHFQNKRLNASSWDTSAGPLMMRLPSQVPRLYWVTVCVFICLFWNLERNISLMCLMFFGLDKKLCWQPCFSSAIPQSNLRHVFQAIVLTLAQVRLFYYRSFICYFHQHRLYTLFCNVFLSVLLYYPNFRVINVLKKYDFFSYLIAFLN